MTELKRSDAEKRSDLLELYKRMQKIMSKINQGEEIIHKQLQQEDGTRDYQRKIHEHMNILRQEECPVVVAGKLSILLSFIQVNNQYYYHLYR